jgi:hypothetical protein
MRMSPEKVTVLLAVLQRAPASLAEQIICREVADWMAAQLAEEQAHEKTSRQADTKPPA